MAWRYEVDIMTTSLLEFKHNACQIFWFDFVTGIRLTDIVVLAKLAAKITSCEENRPRTLRSPEGIFLTHMRTITADLCSFSCLALPQFTFPPIDLALMSTNIAGCKTFITLNDPVFQCSILE
jgi:hypothetical protein